MKRFTILAASSIIGLATVVPSLAEQVKVGKNADKAVREVTARYTAAFNKGDAKALAAFWTPKGDYVGPRGELIKGRDEIQKRFARFFSVNEQVRLKVNVDSIRFIGADVAIVDGTTEVTPPLQGPPVEVRSTVILVKRGKQWLIESARDTLAHVHSNYEHLKELQWMIGDWVDVSTSEDVSVQSSCDWTVNKSFIVRKFTVEVKGRISAAGTQLIGWDPRQSRIRSWLFDSKGDFAEGVWTRQRNRWVVTTSGVLQDGSEVSSTNIITHVDDNTFTFQSVNRTINGQQQPDIEEIGIRRAPLQSGGPDEPDSKKTPQRETVLPE